LTSVREVGEGTRDRVAFVFQQANLIPWRNVLANIGLPLELQNVSSADRSEQIRSAAERVGLLRDDYGKRPSMLSGGMQMRVSLARALVTDPDVLLLDEPFAALDDMLRQQLNEELLRLWQQHQWTTLFVTHNVGEAVFLSERVMVLSRRPGRITESMDVPFAYPRSPELRSSAEFAALCGRLSASLRTDRISNLDGDATSIAHPDTIARIGSSN
jgi:NitT/TauT family transport system ATP-binding protein